MSGICGIVSLDAAQSAATEIDVISARLERRGPHGTHHWCSETAALGHALLATTPEALSEILPLTDAASRCTITADVRLDNREELIAALGLTERAGTVGDGELILRAYLHWAEECPKHLLGDFAFAVWDPRSSQLFCARDHVGMKPFNYYYSPSTVFIFATEAEAVVAHSMVPEQLDEGRIADVIEDMEGIDFTSSFYDRIARLPPAHSLTVSAERFKISRYWTLEPPVELRLDSDEAYAERFREVFTEAVRCRLRSAGRIGSMLSGGMDSGSIAAIAAELLAEGGKERLQTFSAVGPDAFTCIETKSVHASAEAINGIEAHFVNYADLENYREDLIRLWDGAHPFDSHMTLIRALYVAASRQGLNVVLDGVGGDVVLSAGNGVARLLRSGRVWPAWREAKGEQQFWGPLWPAPRTFAIAAWQAVAPRPLRILRRKIARHMREKRESKNRLIARKFATEVNLISRRERFARTTLDRPQSEAQRHADSIQHPHTVAARERYDRVAAELGIEPRDPFLDIRLLTFCLSLPLSQLQTGGWPKAILRRAMKGRLPGSVIRRPGKEHLGWPFTQALLSGWSGWAAELENAVCGRVPSDLEQIRRGTLNSVDTRTKIRLFALLRWVRSRRAQNELAN